MLLNRMSFLETKMFQNYSKGTKLDIISSTSTIHILIKNVFCSTNYTFDSITTSNVIFDSSSSFHAYVCTYGCL